MKNSLTTSSFTSRSFRGGLLTLGAALLLGTTAFAGPHQVWATTLAGLGGAEDAPSVRVLAIDSSGNSYIVGHVDHVSLSTGDAFLGKVDSTGSLVWSTTLNGTGTSDLDQFYDAVVDSSGNVIVTGGVKGATGDYELVTAKYDSAGNPSSTWADVGYGVGMRHYTIPMDDVFGTNVLLDAGGDVIVAGRGTLNLVLLRYNTSGGLSSTWPGGGGLTQGVRTVAPGSSITFYPKVRQDSSGNVYIAATAVTGITGPDYFVAKYNSTGSFQWTTKYSFNTTSITADFLYDFAVDPSGNSYVSGDSGDASGGNQMTVVKFNTSGIQLWAKRITGATGGTSVKVDSSGNVYSTGQSSGGMTVWKFTGAGAASTTWPAGGGNAVGVRHIGSAPTDSASCSALTNTGELYVGGTMFVSGNNIAAWRLNASNGATVWTEQLGAASTDKECYAIKVGPGGHIIATGTTFVNSPLQPTDIQVVRYSP